MYLFCTLLFASVCLPCTISITCWLMYYFVIFYLVCYTFTIACFIVFIIFKYLFVRKFPFTGGPPCHSFISYSTTVSHCFAFIYFGWSRIDSYFVISCYFMFFCSILVILNPACFTLFFPKLNILGRPLLLIMSSSFVDHIHVVCSYLGGLLNLITWSLIKKTQHSFYICMCRCCPYDVIFGVVGCECFSWISPAVLLVWHSVYV